MSMVKIVLVLILILLVAAFLASDVRDYLTLEYVKTQHDYMRVYYQTQPWTTALFFMGFYILITGLSLPGATILTLLAGAIFEFWLGVLLVSFAATFGATLAFLSARLLLRPWIQHRFSSQLQVINQGIIEEGGFYLFSLRMIPLFPFFLVNILMGVTSIRISTYYWISQLGMLPAAMVYVNAGTQLAKIDNLSAILAPNLLFSFILLGLFPWLAKFTIKLFRHAF